MKNFFLLIVFLIFLISAPVLFSLDKKILIVGDQEKEGGYLAEITFEAFQRVGYIPDFRFVPWARALELSIEGYYTMLLGAFYTEEQAEVFAYSEPIWKTRIFLLKRKDLQLTVNTIDDLRPYRIGYIRGASVNEDFDKASRDFLTVEYVSDCELNIRRLLAGRIDLVVGEEERIKELLSRDFREESKNLEIVEPPLQSNIFYNCVSKENSDYQQILEDFNKGLQIIEEDGSLVWILKKHGIIPIK